MAARLLAALNEPIFVTIDGKRRKITKLEVIVTQMVKNAADADLRATKMLIDMMKTSNGRTAWERRWSRAASLRPTSR